MCSGTGVWSPGRGCSANLEWPRLPSPCTCLCAQHCALSVPHCAVTLQAGAAPHCMLASAAQGPTSLWACLCCAGAPLSSIPANQLLALLELHIVIPVPVIEAVWTTPFFGSGVTLDTLLSSGWGTLPGSTPAATIRTAPASNGWVLHLLAP